MPIKRIKKIADKKADNQTGTVILSIGKNIVISGNDFIILVCCVLSMIVYIHIFAFFKTLPSLSQLTWQQLQAGQGCLGPIVLLRGYQQGHGPSGCCHLPQPAVLYLFENNVNSWDSENFVELIFGHNGLGKLVPQTTSSTISSFPKKGLPVQNISS